MKLVTAKLFYRLLGRLTRDRHPRRCRGLPSRRPSCARAMALDARAQPLPPRHVRLGRFRPDRRAVRPRRVDTPGETKYSLRQDAPVRGLDGIVSFSTAPLRLDAEPRVRSSPCSPFSSASRHILVKIFGVYAVPGWASIVVVIALLGGATADRARRHGRVRGADPRRGEASPALPRARPASEWRSSTARCPTLPWQRPLDRGEQCAACDSRPASDAAAEFDEYADNYAPSFSARSRSRASSTSFFTRRKAAPPARPRRDAGSARPVDTAGARRRLRVGLTDAYLVGSPRRARRVTRRRRRFAERQSQPRRALPHVRR